MALVVERVRLRARRRATWLRRVWAEADGYLEDRDAPSLETRWLEEDAEMAEVARAIQTVDEKLAADCSSRLARVCDLLGISGAELDLLHACLASFLDPALARLFAYLNDDAIRPHVTEELLARLFGHGRRLLLGRGSRVLSWRLVERVPFAPGEPDALVIDESFATWLAGTDGMDPTLAAAAYLTPVLEPLPSWPVEATAEAIAQGGDPARICVVGAPGSGRRTFAAAVSACLQRPLICIDADRVSDDRWDETFLRAQRQGHLDELALAWHGEALQGRHWPSHIPGVLVQFVIADSGAPRPRAADQPDRLVTLPPPTVGERRQLWARLVAGADRWPEPAMDALALRPLVNPGDVAAVARRRPRDAREASWAAREVRRHRFGELAERLETPFERDELVVPAGVAQSLADLRFEAQERVAFWERPEARRLFPQGRGLLALFCGPSGTGKTMAAQVLARALDQDLVKVDVAQTISKWVGETAKHLSRILAQAEETDVVLLFDECDALFGKRADRLDDVQARYANADTGHLLQAIESYAGVCILATNKKRSIDTAFMRRVRFVLEFPRPDAGERLKIWAAVVRSLAGEDAARHLAADLHRLSESIDATGAQIKLAVLSAVFRARADGAQLNVAHLLAGIERELAKDGAGLSGRERMRLIGDAA